MLLYLHYPLHPLYLLYLCSASSPPPLPLLHLMITHPDCLADLYVSGTRRGGLEKAHRGTRSIAVAQRDINITIGIDSTHADETSVVC